MWYCQRVKGSARGVLGGGESKGKAVGGGGDVRKARFALHAQRTASGLPGDDGSHQFADLAPIRGGGLG